MRINRGRRINQVSSGSQMLTWGLRRKGVKKVSVPAKKVSVPAIGEFVIGLRWMRLVHPLRNIRTLLQRTRFQRSCAPAAITWPTQPFAGPAESSSVRRTGKEIGTFIFDVEVPPLDEANKSKPLDLGELAIEKS